METNLVLKDEEENKILDYNDEEVLQEAKNTREKRLTLKSEKISSLIFDILDDRVKHAFYTKISNNENELRKYINDMTYKLLYKYNQAVGGKNSSSKKDFKRDYSQFISYMYQQKKNWTTNCISKINSNDAHILEYKKEFYPDIEYNEFSKILIKKLEIWRDDRTQFICEYPLYKYIKRKYSINSSLRYDIGIYVYKNLSESLLSSGIYRTYDFLFTCFSPSTKKLPKYDVLTVNDDNTDKQLVLTESNSNNYVEGLELDSVLPSLKPYDKTNLSVDDLKEIIKFNRFLFEKFDDEDLSIISVVLDNIDRYFYVNRQIIITEKETLETLGKPVNTRNREWLRKRLDKLSTKKVYRVTNNDNDETRIGRFTIFQEVEKNYRTTKKSLKSIRIVVSEHIYNAILKEDTINVYKSEFLKMKNSKFPKAVLLIYQLQVLRISAYLMNEDFVEIRDDFFIEIFNLKKMSSSKLHEFIDEYLNEFKENKVMILDYHYDYHKEIWFVKFIRLTIKDLITLVNQRKDYTKLLNLKNMNQLTMPI